MGTTRRDPSRGIDKTSIPAAISPSASVLWSQITGTPTTLAGYGITDAYTKAQVDAAFAPISHTHAASAIVSGTLAIARGGTNLGSYVKGDILHASATNVLSSLAVPVTDGWVLTFNLATGLPEWRVASGGGAVSSVFGRTGAVVATTGDYTFAKIGSTPTTLAGYGITDAITGSGTTGKLPKFSASQTLADSLLSESGTEVTMAGDLIADLFKSAGFNSSLIESGDTGHFLTRLMVVRAGSAGVIKVGSVGNTIGSPTAVASAQSLGNFSFRGWDGSAMVAGAGLTVRTTQAWTGSARGCAFDISTTPNGSTSSVNALTLDQDGSAAFVGTYGFNGKSPAVTPTWTAPTATLSRTAVATGDTLATTVSHLAALVTDLRNRGIIN